MNNRLLVKKCINFRKENIDFLNFIHPRFNIVENLDEYDNIYSSGIIYVGQFEKDTIDRLNSITPNWIVVNAHHFDVDLSTNEGLIKNLLPIHYVQLKKNPKLNELSIYNGLSYDVLLEKIKICLLSGLPLSHSDDENTSVFSLLAAVLGTPDVLNSAFFNIVNKKNVSVITSSVLTILNRIQSKDIRKSDSVYYSRLISQSEKRYGKRIKQAICKFLKSKANKEISLYNLLTDLNRVK